jgi:hypothetical protein
VTQVEGLLLVDLHQRPLERAVRGVVVDVAEQRDPRAVVEAVGDHQLGPVLERMIEAVRVLELVRLAAVHQLFLVEAQVLEKAVGDVRVRELVLDDRGRRHHRVRRGRVLRGSEVGGRGDELGVGLHQELYDERLPVALGHLVGVLHDEAVLYFLLQLLLRILCHGSHPGVSRGCDRRVTSRLRRCTGFLHRRHHSFERSYDPGF